MGRNGSVQDAPSSTVRRRLKVPDTRTQDEILASSPTYKDAKPIPTGGTAEYPLYDINQVPYYLRDNKYILASYRAFYSARMCWHSIFRLHNETFNIWTHLVGAGVFVVLSAQLFMHILIPEYSEGNVLRPVRNATTGELEAVNLDGERSMAPLAIYGFFSFGCVACMISSAMFHTFLAHMSERVFHFAHALDYFGITILTSSSFVPFCFYVFSCRPALRNAYLLMIGAFGVVGMLGPFFRKWTSEAFATKKIMFYVCMVGSGIVPTLHMMFLPEDNSPYVHRLLQMLILYGVGVFIYAFKIPEIFAPGRFDNYLSSHQIWHAFVLAAALTHFWNAVSMYRNLNGFICEV